jgi:protein involved in polysaccharide export with SLBB domain
MLKLTVSLIALGICTPLMQAQMMQAQMTQAQTAGGAAVRTAPSGAPVPTGLASGVIPREKPQFAARNPRYQIRPADTIELSFYPAAELSQTLSVQPDGYITLREAGDLYVEGKTIPELKEAITLAYRKILNEPVITIVLRDFEKPHFVVGGQVEHPGKYELRADTTATEGVAIAGGLTEKAKHSQVLLFRRVSADWAEVKELNMKAIMRGNWHEDIHLRAGDMLFVPQNRFSKIKPFLPMWTVGSYMGPGAL